MSGDRAQRILSTVDALRDDLIDLTRALVGCRTDSQSEDNPDFGPEAMRCQDIVAEQLTAIGVDVQRWTEDERYPVVAGRLPGSGGGKSLANNGHIDVVPVGDTSTWMHDPWPARLRTVGYGAAARRT